ncbi:potassium/sodium hyperpolarization-activated cyclic nucleotide-gated channel 2-like isoform X1 [Rhipicephalus microplus]|uniref:potassium/sodium hyperpolarization-activated cyclic nucleotide-gated channel 2-like isoform X1 n=1 Tax=Rhipicephalus microplus TaxID=6941 RepID=UPI003F6AF454
MTIVSGKLGASLMHSSSPRRWSARVCGTHEGGLHRSGDDEGHAERETSTYRKRLMTFDIDDPLHRDFLKAVQDRGPAVVVVEPVHVVANGKLPSSGQNGVNVPHLDLGVYPDESLKETGEAHAQTSTWSDCCDPSSVCLPSRRRRNASFFGSAEELNRERSRQESSGHCIIHPCSVFRMYWDLCLTVLLVANLVLIPVDVAFYADPGDLYWMAFHLTSDAIFFVDIVFNFRTGVITTEGVERVNLDPKYIARHYLKTWFLLDFLSTVPFDYICVLVETAFKNLRQPGALSAIRLLHLAKLLGLLKLLRLSRLCRYLSSLQEHTFAFSSTVYLSLANIVGFMLLIAHWNGCLQFFVAMMQGFPENSWVQRNGIHNRPIFEQYSWSMFNALSQMLSIGYGQNAPATVIDMWLVTLGMLTGATGYALLIGHATTLIQSLDYTKRLHREKMERVEEYMQYRRMPKDLRFRVRNYFEHRHEGKAFDEDAILAELSQPLKEDVMKHNCRATLRAVPFLSHVDPGFVSDLVTRLRYEFFQPGDVIIQQGSVGRKMYFIQSGTVKLLLDGSQFLGTLSEGSYFGEICLLTKTTRNASVIADTYCDLFSLSVENFNEVLQQYPLMRSSLEATAAQRIAHNSAFRACDSEHL